MVSTQDSESCDPSSNLGRTWIFSKHCFSFFLGVHVQILPTAKKLFFPFPHLWHPNCVDCLFIFHICGIQAVPLTFIKHLTFKDAHTLWTIMAWVTSEHRWFSGRMLACHAGGPGSIPGRCSNFSFRICFPSQLLPVGLFDTQRKKN